MQRRVRAVRGAIVVPGDSAEAILSATARLLSGLMDTNRLETGDLISILFTATSDLTAAFPAEAARRMGLASVPLICAREIEVPGSLGRVVRVLAHAETGAETLTPVYMDGAEALRDDLA